MKTLITAASSAEAQRLKHSLTTEIVILGDYRELPDFMLKAGKMIRLPNPDAIAYTHEMLALCLDNDIDAVYALKQEEEILLREAMQLFDEYGIKIMQRP